eukprot:32775_1
MDYFLSDVLQCNIIPFLLFHETRRISRVCTLFNSVVTRSKYHEPNDKELQQNAKDWMHNISKCRTTTMDILQVDDDTFDALSSSYLSYFMIFQSYLYGKMPSQFVSLINTRKIAVKSSSLQTDKLIDFVCNIVEYIRVPSCEYLNDLYNASPMTINALDLSDNNLRDSHIMHICQAMVRRYNTQGKYTFLRHFNMSNNPQITQYSMQILFQTLSLYCPFLKTVDLSRTNVSNRLCLIILQSEPIGSPRCIHIKLYQTQIDSNGIQCLLKRTKTSKGIRVKIYHDHLDSKRTVKSPSQRSIRDLFEKQKKKERNSTPKDNTQILTKRIPGSG